MNHQNNTDSQKEGLLAIAKQAKKLLLCNERAEAEKELLKLGEIVGEYESNHPELSPKLTPYGRRAWYSKNAEGETIWLDELLKLHGENALKND